MYHCMMEFFFRKSVRIALKHKALNGIDVFAAGIKNSFIQENSSQKYYTICGLEFVLENKSTH